MLFHTVLALAAYAAAPVAADVGWRYCNQGTYGDGGCEQNNAWTYCILHAPTTQVLVISAISIAPWTSHREGHLVLRMERTYAPGGNDGD
ncbi:hypothetical protein E4U53_007276 [Claviceps sorghi]|nr:hypothetical protein E4U53_007276 [Claviceps sorghi]